MIVLLPLGERNAGDTVNLNEDEVHHLRVRRAAPRSAVELRDGGGLVGTGELIATDARRGQVRISEVRREPRPDSLALYVAAGDKERFGWLVEKAAELGVTEIVPVETERVRGVASRVTASQLPRLARRALDAIKQSGAAWAPVVREPVEFAAMLEAVEALGPSAPPAPSDVGVRWLADVSGGWPAAGLASGAISVLVGPEGGFSDAERAAAIAAGWGPTRLGHDVLRFETAAVAAATIIGIARGRGVT